MFPTMSNTEAVQMIGAMFIIATVGVLVLLLLAVLVPERFMAGSEQRIAPFALGEYGEPGHVFAQRYEDEGYVSQLMRVQARIPVIYRPDPVKPVRVCDPRSPYHVELATLVAQAQRYVAPPASAPVSPARHYSGTVDTAALHSEYVGGHRALPELVAA